MLYYILKKIRKMNLSKQVLRFLLALKLRDNDCTDHFLLIVKEIMFSLFYNRKADICMIIHKYDEVNWF